MARKGKKRSIQVWGCDLEDGTKITNDDEGIVSVIVNGDHSVTVTDFNHIKRVVDGARWVSYAPRQNWLKFKESFIMDFAKTEIILKIK